VSNTTSIETLASILPTVGTMIVLHRGPDRSPTCSPQGCG
jgi:hypothetical protein